MTQTTYTENNIWHLEKDVGPMIHDAIGNYTFKTIVSRE